MATDKPRAPRGLGTSGQRLWHKTTGEYELAEHEQALLTQACRLVDHADALEKLIARDGRMQTVSLKEAKAHPALVEARQLSVALGRVLHDLGVPMGLNEPTKPAKARHRSRSIRSVGA